MENSSLLECEWDIHSTNRKEINPDFQNDDLVEEKYNRLLKTEGDQQVATGITQTPIADLEITQNVPDLPTGKDKYFFVCYSSEDNDHVWSIVNELEDRFKLPCVYSNRDFKPGRNTQECIKEGMARSFKVLMFLTPNFHQSGWCYQEREYAFNCSIESKSNYIIPVKLQQCEIPSALIPLTYVDATDPSKDIAAKIASALIETEAFEPERLLPKEFSSSIKRYENGYSFGVYGEREKTCMPCRPAKYKFEPSFDLYKKLRVHNVIVPNHLLIQVFKFINCSYVMQWYDYRKKRNICCWWICTIPGFFFTMVFISMVEMLSTMSMTRLSKNDEEYNRLTSNLGVLFIVIMSVVPFVLLIMCCIPGCCSSKKRNISLQRKIWDKFGDGFISNGVLLIFSGVDNTRPKLVFMRYNFLKCKDYLETVIMETYPNIPEASVETRALSLIKVYVREILPVLADDFENLANAPYNRHNVTKGKMCLCQHIELNIV